MTRTLLKKLHSILLYILMVLHGVRVLIPYLSKMMMRELTWDTGTSRALCLKSLRFCLYSEQNNRGEREKPSKSVN